MNKRLPYLDIAKGMLILMVVLGHMPQVADIYSIHNPTFEFMRGASKLWVGFYMPAFFFITGMCSNFRIPFARFLVKNMKTLMLPSFTLMALTVWINNVLKGTVNIVDYLSVGFSTFLKNGGVYWFLTALFFAKIIYWVVVKLIHSEKWQLVVFMFFMVLGTVCNNLLSFEPWYVYHTMTLVIFLFVGDLYGKNLTSSQPSILLHRWVPSYGLGGGVLLYIFLIAVMIATSVKIPAITQRINLTVVEIPILLILSLSGTFMLILLSKAIGNCALINSIGRHTLVIYCLHVFFARVLFEHFRIFLNDSSYYGIIIGFLLVVANVMLCYMMSFLLNTKYLKFLIGKF